MKCRVTEAGNKQVLKFDCRSCDRSPSIAKSEVCMREVLQKLSENPSADEILLGGDYIQEYDGKNVDLLKELVHSLEDSRYLVLKNIKGEECGDCYEERKKRIAEIWNTLKMDPARGCGNLEQLKAELEEKSKRGSKKCKNCRRNFLKKGVEPALSILERTSFLKESRIGGGRRDYEKILNPSIRPCFLRSKLKLQPPNKAELVDAYNLEDSEIRIYRLDKELQHMYFLMPLEYRLPPDRVRLLQEARQLLLKRKGNLKLKLARKEIERNSRKLIMESAINKNIDLNNEEIENLSKCLTRFTAGFGILETLLGDPRVQDVYSDAPIDESPLHIYHREFEECSTNIFLTPEDAKFLISRFRAVSGRSFSEADPILDLNLGGVRVAAIQRPLSPNGLALALRRHKTAPWTLPLFIKNDFLTARAAGLLSLLVDSQASILITGSRGAGKTSLLGALLLELLPKYRVLCLEDTAELPVDQLRSLGFKIQSLRVQPAIAGSQLELKAEDALRAALRLGESVLVVGEVRGPETKALYEAMRVGAAGNSVMGTIHGATTEDVFERVVYDLGIPASSFKATDVIAVASPIRPKGSVNRVRRVTQISEVGSGWKDDPISEGGFTDLMCYDPSKDELAPDLALQETKSDLLKSIARKWSTNREEVRKNMDLRAKIQRKLVETANEMSRPDLLEADKVVQSNLTFHRLLEEELKDGRVRYDRIFERWQNWLYGVSK